jgi:hypothetical protein
MLDEPVLVVSEGFNALARALVRQRRDEQIFEIWDGGGREIGRVEPADRDPVSSKLLRLIFALIFTSSARRNARSLRVVDGAGATLLDLRLEGRVVLVRDPAGTLVGEIHNISMVGRLKAAFYGEEVPRGLFRKTPPAIATLHHKVDQPPFEYELTSASGTVFARVSNSGNRRNALELLDRSDPRLATLALGFACGLVDRLWLRVPVGSSGGGG